MPSFIWDTTTAAYKNLQGGSILGGGTTDPSALAYDWSDDNNPALLYTSTADFTEGWPAGTVYRDLAGVAGDDLHVRMLATTSGMDYNDKCVIRLPAGTYHLKSFHMIGSSGDPLYAFGAWVHQVQGFLGAGPDKTFIQMDKNAMTQAQINAMASYDPTTFTPIQIGMMRLDGDMSGHPVLLGGVTFCAEDQPNITTVHANLTSAGVVVPQPAPHNGIVIFPNSASIINNCRFIGVARSMTSAPPFECFALAGQYGTDVWRRIEIDGRRAAWIDPARPRRSSLGGANNQSSHYMEDSWMHHSAVSRYGVNDENRNTSGAYSYRRIKIEQVEGTRNTDPALNGGVSLGGWNDPSCMGWESVNGTITFDDCIISQDNNRFTYQSAPPAHYNLTSTGSRNPQGGRMVVRNTVHRNTGWPQLDGFATFRIAPNTYWATDGFNTTLALYNAGGTRLIPYKYTGTWPMSAAAITAAGITPETHFIVRSQ